MATPSGTIGLSDVNAELGFSPTALITMNDAAVRTLAGVPTGTISMQNLQNKSNRVSIPLTISTNTNNYDVYANRGPTYNPGKSDITVTINPGVLVGSASTGAYAFLVPSAFSPADTITVINNGTIQGQGGNGGAGGAGQGLSVPAPGSGGGSGGNAVYVNRPTVITNNGNIWAGGGGGGGGGGAYNVSRFGFEAPAGGGGGGGGRGASSSSGGGGGAALGNGLPGFAGGPGSSGAAGGGGSGRSFPPVVSGPGGAGGGAGANGGSGSSATHNPTAGTSNLGSGAGGGSAGFYIVGNAFVTYPATGSRLGNVG